MSFNTTRKIFLFLSVWSYHNLVSKEDKPEEFTSWENLSTCEAVKNVSIYHKNFHAGSDFWCVFFFPSSKQPFSARLQEKKHKKSWSSQLYTIEWKGFLMNKKVFFGFLWDFIENRIERLSLLIETKRKFNPKRRTRFIIISLQSETHERLCGKTDWEEITSLLTAKQNFFEKSSFGKLLSTTLNWAALKCSKIQLHSFIFGKMKNIANGKCKKAAQKKYKKTHFGSNPNDMYKERKFCERVRSEIFPNGFYDSGLFFSW